MRYDNGDSILHIVIIPRIVLHTIIVDIFSLFLFAKLFEYDKSLLKRT